MKLNIGKKKKSIILLAVIVLFLVAGGFFYWQENQKDVRKLNKNLPAGVRVEKSLIGNEYKVVNKIDGYEFKVPREWGGLKEIEYYKQTEKESAGISIDTQKGNMFGVGVIDLKSSKIDLKSWIQEKIIKSNPSFWSLEKQHFNNVEVIKLTIKKDSLSGFPSYYFKSGSKIYYFGGPLKGTIRKIILNGKW